MSVPSCLAHIHKVAFRVASWGRSTQPPPPPPPPPHLAVGDQNLDIVLQAIAELQMKVTSMKTRLQRVMKGASKSRTETVK